uniref:Large ribosomal subunit protein uL13c n=1 Tax=Hypericum perforatum TaxID=65561 RepID=A0A3S9Y2H6_HYPPE|nr:ribosomal protein L [Hypericum perforatum]
MAVLCASSTPSSTCTPISTISTPRISSSSSSSSLLFPARPLFPTKKPYLLQACCEKVEKDKHRFVSKVPLDQRWMFEECEVDGPDIWNNTWYPKAKDHINTDKQWYVVDATDKVLGRLASTIAIYIRGKNLATFTPSVDMGSFVIVTNAEKVYVSGNKRTQKLYRRHSGRPGGMTVETFDQLQNRIPERIIEHAVRGMLPKGRLGRQLFNHLKVYKGPEHPHEAQKPIDLPLTDKRIQKELD